MNYIEAKKRYLYDAKFHALVDFFYKALLDQDFTPYELADAYNYACLKFCQENGFPNVKSGDKGR